MSPKFTAAFLSNMKTLGTQVFKPIKNENFSIAISLNTMARNCKWLNIERFIFVTIYF